MQRPLLLTFLLAVTFIVTLPFGAWRARCRKFSLSWWLAIHLIIPVIILMRVWAGFSYAFIPLFIAATILGQIAGGRIRGGAVGAQGAPRQGSGQAGRGAQKEGERRQKTGREIR